MTVGDLRRFLADKDANLPVLVPGYEGCFDDCEFTIGNVYSITDLRFYGGNYEKVEDDSAHPSVSAVLLITEGSI